MALRNGIDLIVFDVYNTLFNNDDQCWLGTFQMICDDQELSILPKDLWVLWKDISLQLGLNRAILEEPEYTSKFKTYQEHWVEVFQQTFRQLDIEASAEKASLFCVQGLSKRDPYEETLNILSHIGKNWKIAAVTNADNASLFPLLKEHNLHFDHVLTSEILGAYKPDPLVFKSIIDISGIPANRVLFVGDTQLDDIHGAKTASMSAIWVNRHGLSLNPALIPPAAEINDLNQLIDILA